MACLRASPPSCACRCAPAKMPRRRAAPGRASGCCDPFSTPSIRPRPSLFLRMVEVLLALAGLEALAARRRLGGPRLDEVLEQHVHEHEHRLGLDDQRARRLVLAGVEVLVHAVVMHDRDVAGLPVVAHAIVDLVADAVEDVERRLVDMAMLLRLAPGPVFLEVQVKRLRDPVFRLDVVPAPGCLLYT